MAKRILYTRPSGQLSIVVPSGKIEDAVKDVPEGIPYEIVDERDIPSDRTFRDAWEHDTSTSVKKIRTNIPKARRIAHNERRKQRTEAFAPLDVKATIPAEAVVAEMQRQNIRSVDANIQTAIDGAKTERALKVLMATSPIKGTLQEK